tara:strand:- start:31 stop:618 length:588 start_codon:yes stop_codon:yes gene_type:complete
MFFLSFFISVNCLSQFGTQAGLTHSNNTATSFLPNNEIKLNLGFYLSTFFTYKINDNIKLKSELNIYQGGYTGEAAGYESNYNYNVKYNFIGLSEKLYFVITTKWHVGIGIGLHYILSGNSTHEYNGNITHYEINPYSDFFLDKFIFNGAINVCYIVNKKWFIDLEYKKNIATGRLQFNTNEKYHVLKLGVGFYI